MLGLFSGIFQNLLRFAGGCRFDFVGTLAHGFHIYIGDMDNFDLKIPFLEKVIDELYDEDKGSIDLSSHTEATVALE